MTAFTDARTAAITAAGNKATAAANVQQVLTDLRNALIAERVAGAACWAAIKDCVKFGNKSNGEIAGLSDNAFGNLGPKLAMLDAAIRENPGLQGAVAMVGHGGQQPTVTASAATDTTRITNLLNSWGAL